MEKNEIIKLYGTDYRNMAKELLMAADAEALLPGRDARIGIKPNLVCPSPAEYGSTTHPELVAGIIEYLQERDYRNLVILEGSWVGDSTKDAFAVCGYEALSERYGVPLIDLQKDTAEKRDCAGLELNICSTVNSIDFLINVPVLKGHCQTKMTCALKNMKGLLPNSEKRHFHAMGLHRPIAHLNAAVRQDLILIDHICGDLDFEDGGHPVQRDCIMAARDPVLADAYACRLLGLTPDEVPYVRLSESLGAGCADLSRANIHALHDYDPEGDDARRADRKLVELSDAVSEVESCSACYGTLIPALDRLRSEGKLEELKAMLPGRICIGQGYRGKTGAFGVGACTAKFDFSIPGCPPEADEIYHALLRYMEEHKA